MANPGLILRPALPADPEFLLRVYAASREMEMAMVPWPAEQKSTFLRLQFVEEFNPSLHLFETLGFAKESAEGIHQLLRWLPRDTQP